MADLPNSFKDQVKLIVNADDFGKTSGVNAGIIKAHKDGIVTSTSLMVNAKAAREAKSLSKYPKLSLGLHFELPDKKLESHLIHRFPITKEVGDYIKLEFERQLSLFIQLTGRNPDHLDSHKHIHGHPTVKKLFVEYSQRFKIPTRDIQVKCIRDFFGWNVFMKRDLRKISVESLISILSNLKPGTHELMCHPGIVDNELYASKYNEERAEELKTLTHMEVKSFISTSGIQLTNWSDASCID